MLYDPKGLSMKSCRPLHCSRDKLVAPSSPAGSSSWISTGWIKPHGQKRLLCHVAFWQVGKIIDFDHVWHTPCKLHTWGVGIGGVMDVITLCRLPCQRPPLHGTIFAIKAKFRIPRNISCSKVFESCWRPQAHFTGHRGVFFVCNCSNIVGTDAATSQRQHVGSYGFKLTELDRECIR